LTSEAVSKRVKLMKKKKSYKVQVLPVCVWITVN